MNEPDILKTREVVVGYRVGCFILVDEGLDCFVAPPMKGLVCSP
ncbi:hypothetical protein [uncultured Draconibacterium sp.]|nr:hypothetical protein [uncultured Draconibacterium sp.]